MRVARHQSTSSLGTALNSASCATLRPPRRIWIHSGTPKLSLGTKPRSLALSVCHTVRCASSRRARRSRSPFRQDGAIPTTSSGGLNRANTSAGSAGSTQTKTTSKARSIRSGKRYQTGTSRSMPPLTAQSFSAVRVQTRRHPPRKESEPLRCHHRHPRCRWRTRREDLDRETCGLAMPLHRRRREANLALFQGHRLSLNEGGTDTQSMKANQLSGGGVRQMVRAFWRRSLGSGANM